MEGRSDAGRASSPQGTMEFNEAAIMDDRKNYALPCSSHLSSDAAAAPLIEMMRRPDHW